MNETSPSFLRGSQDVLERAKLLCVCVPVNLQEDNVPELGMRGEGLVDGGKGSQVR